MPVLIQGSSVVVLNSALERCLDGGVDSFARFSPNARAYSDDFLSQCSFMQSADADDFLQRLALRGVAVDGESPEAVIVNAGATQASPDYDWLQVLEYNGHLIGRHRNDESTTLIAFAGFDIENPPEVKHFTHAEILEKLEYVRREGSVEVYRDKQTGEELYVGRTTDSLEDIFQRSGDTIRKYLRDPGRPPAPENAHPEIREAIGGLQRVAAKSPDFWQAWLLLGKGWQALDQHDRAYQNLLKAWHVDDSITATCKELAGVCLELSRFDEGVKYAERAVSLDPVNAELLCNLAVNHLLAGNGDAAQKSIARAIALNANDPVNRNVDALVGSVIRGERDWPKSFAELTRRAPPAKRTWWQRLLGK